MTSHSIEIVFTVDEAALKQRQVIGDADEIAAIFTEQVWWMIGSLEENPLFKGIVEVVD